MNLLIIKFIIQKKNTPQRNKKINKYSTIHYLNLIHV